MSVVSLPLRDGIGASSVSLPAGSWQTVLAFLIDRFPGIDAATWRSRMQRGDVLDERGTPLSPASDYRSGMRVYYYRDIPDETPIPFEEAIVYRDDHILVADKPHFLPVMPAGRFARETLLVRLKRKLGLDFLAPIHRLDRDTAGVVLFSTQPETRGRYHALFARREVDKTYEALAGRLAGATFPLTRRSRLEAGEPFFLMREVEGEANAETTIDVIEAGSDVARYRLSPVTGRKHQLRVHMAVLGIPILNDLFYPKLAPDRGDDFSRPLQLLARSLAFTDPLSGTPRRFESRRVLALSDESRR